MAVKSVNPIDRHVGARLRVQRMVRGVSQIALAEAVSVSFQQVQKYEKGQNRISASRLQEIANVLRVTPDLFFDRASESDFEARPQEMVTFEAFMSSRDGIALCKAFTHIGDAKMRRNIVALVEELAEV
jgi:transcriptional regulator with XRE-family HTH domain